MTNSSIPFGPGFARVLAFVLALASAGAAAAGDAAPAVRSHLQPVSEIASPPVTGEGLGIRLTRASAVLRQQLALDRGAGLVVEEVVAGSRAATAGFVQHDVLVRLDDQLLVLPQQFDALLEAARPVDPLVCTVLRGGREVRIPLHAREFAGRTAAAGSAPAAAPVRRPLRPAASSLALVPTSRPAAAPTAAASRPHRLSDETLVRQDADFEIRLSRGDQTRLMVRDAAGQVVFDGPIDATAERSRVPAAIASRVADMERLLEPRPAVADVARPVAEIGRLEIAPVELR